MTLKELITSAGIIPLGDYEKTAKIKGITSDSEKIKPGFVFFALNGEHFDGHRFIGEATKRGAIAAVIENGKYVEAEIPLFGSDNTRRALSYAVDAFCGCPSKKLKIIAVTGTNGKTTISGMIAAILKSAGMRVGVIGSTGIYMDGQELKIKSRNPLANMTTPDPEELYLALKKMKKCGIEYVVMEASSHSSHFDKLSPLYFNAAVFSNLSPEHLDLHKNTEAYFLAKRDIMRKSERAIINTDDSYGKRLYDTLCDSECISVSAKDEKSRYRVKNIKKLDLSGMRYKFSTPTKEIEINLPLLGEYNVENSALAIGACLEIGIPMAVIKPAIESFSGIPGRLRKIDIPDGKFHVFIDYAHTPKAFESVFNAFSNLECGRIITVFGCGGDRDREKRPEMGRIAAKYSDYLLLTSDNSRSEEPEDIINEIISGIPKNFKSYKVIQNRKEAIEYAVSAALPGDVILLLGKGHEKYEIDKYGRHPFDEEAVVHGACMKRTTQNQSNENYIQ